MINHYKLTIIDHYDYTPIVSLYYHYKPLPIITNRYETMIFPKTKNRSRQGFAAWPGDQRHLLRQAAADLKGPCEMEVYSWENQGQK